MRTLRQLTSSVRAAAAALLLAGLLAGAAAGAGGCAQDPVKAPPPGRLDLLPARAYPQNVAVDGLDVGLVFGAPVVDAPTDNRPLRVSQPVRNVADYPLNIQYQFEFFDDQHRPLRAASGWRFMNLDPRVEKFLEANALETEAVDWRLTVRSAR